MAKVFFGGQLMHATSLCIAVNKRTGEICVMSLNGGSKLPDGDFPGIYAWGECNRENTTASIAAQGGTYPPDGEANQWYVWNLGTDRHNQRQGWHANHAYFVS